MAVVCGEDRLATFARVRLMSSARLVLRNVSRLTLRSLPSRVARSPSRPRGAHKRGLLSKKRAGPQDTEPVTSGRKSSRGAPTDFRNMQNGSHNANQVGRQMGVPRCGRAAIVDVRSFASELE